MSFLKAVNFSRSTGRFKYTLLIVSSPLDLFTPDNSQQSIDYIYIEPTILHIEKSTVSIEMQMVTWLYQNNFPNIICIHTSKYELTTILSIYSATPLADAPSTLTHSHLHGIDIYNRDYYSNEIARSAPAIDNRE